MPLLDTATSVQPRRASEATGVTAGTGLVKLLEGVAVAQEPFLQRSGLLLWRKEKKLALSGREFVPVNSWLALAGRDPCAPGCAVAPVLREVAMLELWAPTEGADQV